jgi:hypothetical protein
MFRGPVRIGRWFAALAKLGAAKFHKTPAAIPMSRWPIVARFDVMGRPALVLGNPAGGEVALDYSAFQTALDPNTPRVPVEWVRAFGVEIDHPYFDGMLLSRRFRKSVPFVLAGNDGTALVYTPKTVLTRIGGEWKRGFHLTVEGMRMLRRVGNGADSIIAESQAALRHPCLQKESERVGPRTRVLATGIGRSIVIDDHGARSHIGNRWVPGIQFPRAVVDSMRLITDLAEKRRHLAFVEYCDAIGPAMCDGINDHVMDRCAGIYEDNLPGLQNLRFSDSELLQADRIAAEAIARAARVS